MGPDSRAKHSQNIKRQHGLQHADASISYRIIQKALSGPGNYVVQVDAKSPSPVIPTVKPELDKNSCSLIKFLSSSYSLPPVQTPRYDHGASFGIKVEPEEDFKLNPDPEAFDRKDLSQAPAMVPGVCSAENIQSDHSPPVTGGKDLHRCVKGHQRATKTPLTGHRSKGLISIRPRIRPGTVYRPRLISKRHISLILHYLSRPRAHSSRANRLSTQVAVQPPWHPQPPEDHDHELPEHQFTPQSSRLLKSLYGLAECLGSQTDAFDSSFQHGNTSSPPTFNQGQPNGTHTSNTTGTVNDSANNWGQDTALGTDEPNDVGLAGLDPSSLYQLGTFLCSLALQLDRHAANAEPSQDYLPDSFYIPPNDPGLRYTHPDNPGIYDNLTASQPPSTFRSQAELQSRIPETYTGGAGPNQQISAGTRGSQPWRDMLMSVDTTQTHIGHQLGGEHSHDHLNEHHSSPHSTMSSQHLTAINPLDNPDLSLNAGFRQHLHTFRAGQPDPESSTSAGARRIRNRGPKVCEDCHQVFRRASYLREHMHIHTGIKAHKCQHCHTPIAYRTGISKHLKRCPAIVRQPQQ